MSKRIEPMERREIIRRLKMGDSIRGIHKDTGLSRDTVREIKEFSIKKGWIKSEKLPTEKEIAEYFNKENNKVHPLDKIKEKIKGWINAGYTYIVITQLVNKRSFDYSESAVRRYIQKHYPKLKKPVIRRNFAPGETAEVDFGYLKIMYDEKTDRNRKTWLFSMRLNYSRKTYRAIVFDQDAKTFFRCQIHALEYIGGVVKKVVCDNLKAAVIKACMYDPLINKAYKMLAEYYGFVINACIAGKPEHKGGVEKDVDYVKRNFYPLFIESQKEKGRKIPFYKDAVIELKKWTKEVDDNHIIKNVGQSPASLFEEEIDKLQPVPMQRWDMVTPYNPKVNDDWRIQVDKAFYTVPFKLIGEKVEAYMNSFEVVIFHKYEQVTRHKKAENDWEVVSKDEHAPPNYAEYLRTTSKGVLEWAGTLGGSVREFVNKLINQKGVDGLRPARRVCKLSKKYGKDSLEESCKRCLEYNAINFRSFKKILEEEQYKYNVDDIKKGIKNTLGSIKKIFKEKNFKFARTADYFNLKKI